MNLGGDPERDDFGLPPVDIEIPDDARELDRDVQAYRRELRAQRRRMHARRLHGPLTRDGMVLPLLAGCLVLALISGTLLTLFSAGQSGLPGRAAARTTATGNSASRRATSGTTAGQIGGPLPDKTLVVAGRPRQLRLLRPAVLALIPVGCQCAAALRELASQATTARVVLYFIGTGGAAAGQLKRLATETGQRAVQVAVDVHNVLGATYKPSGLTAILVHADGTVAQVQSGLRPGLALTGELTLLSAGHPAGS